MLDCLVVSYEILEHTADVRIRASGNDLAGLLRGAVYIHYTRKMIFSDAEVEVADDGVLRAGCTLRGEAYDPARHELGYDIKAVTYHDLKIDRAGDRLSAEIVFDV